MTRKTASYLDELLAADYEARLTIAGLLPVPPGAPAPLPDDSVYNKKLKTPGYPDPHCAYFFYVRIDSDGMLRVDHYFYPGGDHDDPANPANPTDWRAIPDRATLEPIIRTLALNARPSTKIKNPPRIKNQYSFTNIHWHRRSWIVIFIDEVNWTLNTGAGGASHPPILFTVAKDGDPDILPNHTFFDAEDFEIEMPKDNGTTDKRTAVAFVNHMKKDKNGLDLGANESQKFQFNIYFNVAYSSGGNTPLQVIFDPVTQNDGPPLPP